MCSVRCIIYSVRSIMCSVRSIMYSVKNIMCRVRSFKCSVRIILCSMRSIMYSVWSIMCSVWSIMCSVRCGLCPWKWRPSVGHTPSLGNSQELSPGGSVCITLCWTIHPTSCPCQYAVALPCKGTKLSMVAYTSFHCNDPQADSVYQSRCWCLPHCVHFLKSFLKLKVNMIDYKKIPLGKVMK